MKKKLLSLVLAATMLLGASLSVSAADTTDNNKSGTKDVTGQIEAEGSVQEITISVTVTTVSGGNTVLLNPYGMEVNNKTDTLIMDDIKFKNNTSVPVAIKLSGAVDLSGNTTIDVIPGLTPPATPPARKQVNVNVIYQSSDANNSAKMVTLATATKADDAVPYAKLGTGANLYTALAKYPVLAKSGETDVPKDTKGSPITNTSYSDTVVLKFGGWSAAAANEQWPSDAKIKVITVYNIETIAASKRTIFKTFP